MLIITDLVTTDARNTKSARTESKMSDITDLATKAAPNSEVKEIENKLPDTTNFLSKGRSDYIIKNVDSNKKRNKIVSNVCFKLFYW